MKVLVIYDSVFGNTEKVARAIAEGLGEEGDRRDETPGRGDGDGMAGYDLLVVGSPTRGFRPTEGLVALLNQLPAGALKGRRAAAFDTRIRGRPSSRHRYVFLSTQAAMLPRRSPSG